MLRVGAWILVVATVVLGAIAEQADAAGLRLRAAVGDDGPAWVDAPPLGDWISPAAPRQRWIWPVAGASVVRPYVASATRYGSGHRGVDLGASVGSAVVAPTRGTVLFVGRVVDRGVLTLDVGGGRVVTLEPIATALTVGTVVAGGDALGTVGVGGHTPPGALHLGVRAAGEYVDPMTFFGGAPRAILLPCC